ncbi:hypothetical protein CRUP_025374 [Coryphaenoides rupestris]|nr:hypothetical protein CRUP_025374 [Coryphaenoides rupestris]
MRPADWISVLDQWQWSQRKELTITSLKKGIMVSIMRVTPLSWQFMHMLSISVGCESASSALMSLNKLVPRSASSETPDMALLKFLVDNNNDCEEAVQCANCDRESNKKVPSRSLQDIGGMYFCNTCNQPLCGVCREATHKARMFAHHDIVSLAKRTKASHRKCCEYVDPPLHEEPYILFSTEKKSMLCIKCFRDMQGRSRSLQTSTREAIVLLRAMIGEVCLNVEEEESAICSLFNSLQVHLVTCSAFLCSANKFEFLDMGYQLMERLKRIIKLPHRLRPVQSSKINTDYRSEFARCLESFLLIGPRCPPSLAGSSTMAVRLQSPLSVSCRSPSLSDMPGGSVLGRRPTHHRYICTKSLQGEIQSLKDRVQELHRDLTKHHSIINTATMGQVLDRSLSIDQQIAAQHTAVDTMRLMFEEIWDETFQRVSNEQEIYEAQLHDLLQLKQENCYLTTIARQISPYICSIAKVKERLEPRLKEAKSHHDDRTERMLQIYEDGGAETRENPDSEHQQTVSAGRDLRPDRTPVSAGPGPEESSTDRTVDPKGKSCPAETTAQPQCGSPAVR